MAIIRVAGANRFVASKQTVEDLRKPLAQAGYDVTKLRTRKEWTAAIDASFAQRMRSLAAEMKGEDPHLDAILSGLPGWD